MTIEDGLLLEREHELASLDSALHSARHGRGSVVVVEGVAGIGKSRLLMAARERAHDTGLQVLDVYGSELARTVAFGVARQLLGDAGADALELAAAVAATAADGPLLLTIDDAQWADEPSLRLLGLVSVGIERLPVTLAVAIGSSEPDSKTHPLQRLREMRAARVLTLQPLSEAAIETLVTAAFPAGVDSRLPAACLRATGGNPFYVRELLRSLREGTGLPDPDRVADVAPAGIRRAVTVRLARLGEDAVALSRAVAVLGDGIGLSIAGELAQLSEDRAEDAADLLAASGFLAPDEPLRFVHPLVAAGVQSEMAPFKRARSHRIAADLLTARGASPDRVATHLLQARPSGDQGVVSVLSDAAAEAISTGSPSLAMRFLERALREPPAPEAEPAVLVDYTRAQTLAGSPGAGAPLVDALARIAPGEGRSEAICELAMANLVRCEFSRAAELVAGARTELAAEHPAQQRLLGIEVAALAQIPGRRDAAERLLAPVLSSMRHGRGPSDTTLLAVAIAELATVEPAAFVRQLVEPALAADPLLGDGYGVALERIAAALEWTDELAFAEAWLSRAIETAMRVGTPLVRAAAIAARARVRHHRGRLSAAADDSARAVELYGELSATPPWTIAAAVRIALAAGDLLGARTMIENGLSGAPNHEELLEVRAAVHLADGDPAAALRTAEAVRACNIRAGAQPRVWGYRRLASLAAHQLGDDAQALALIAPDLDVLRTIGPARPLGAALTIAGMATGGRDGIALLEEAANLLDASPARLQRAESLLHLGAALRRDGRRKAAEEPLRRARELAAEIGAQSLADGALDELRRLGLRPRRAAQSGPGSLTPSERRVAQLAAEGLSTPRIAARLYVSRNTVATHLRHVYRKLDLAGRGELALALAPPAGWAGDPSG